MKLGTIEDLIQDYNDIANRKNILIPYNLHDGLRAIQKALGGGEGSIAASKAMEWFQQYRRDRHIGDEK